MKKPNRGHGARVRLLSMIIALLAFSGLAGCGDDDDGAPDGQQGENTAPVIDSLRISVPVTAPSDSVRIWCHARDADDDALVYAWQAADGTISGSGPAVDWIAAGGTGAHAVTVTATDGRGGVARDSISIDVMEGSLLVQTRGGLIAIGARGDWFVFSALRSSVEVLETRIFVKGQREIQELDHTGAGIQTIEISDPAVSGHDFAMLPSGGFAFASNDDDIVHFMTADGMLVESVPMPNPSPESLQNIDGTVVDNRLILSENGNNELVAFDLSTRAASIFRSFPEWGGWLGAIDHDGDLFYLCGGTAIRRFTETGEPEDVARLPAGNITGIVVVGNYAYAVVNFEGSLHRIDVRTGADAPLVTGLDYPQDIEHLPVRLAPR